jgi:hypothetical protein
MGIPSCGTEVDTNAIPISQQPPFRYVDALLSLDRDARQAELRLSLRRGQHRWSGTGALPSFLLIEAMAQAAAVLLRKITAGEPSGYLVGIENALLPAEVCFPAELDIRARLVKTAPPFFTLEVHVGLADEASVLAHAELQIMTKRRLT